MHGVVDFVRRVFASVAAGKVRRFRRAAEIFGKFNLLGLAQPRVRDRRERYYQGDRNRDFRKEFFSRHTLIPDLENVKSV